MDPLTIMGIGSAIGGISSLLGGQAAGEGAAQAGKDQAYAMREGTAENKRQFDIGQENVAPYLEAGKYGLEQYLGGLKQDLPQWGGFTAADMQNDPGYQFRQEQGLCALDRMYASRGQGYSGNRGIGLQQWGQNFASQEFGAARARAFQDYSTSLSNHLTRLGQWANLAQSGQQAAGAASSLGMQYAAQNANILQAGATGMGNAAMAQGNATAAGYMGVGNAITSGLAGYQYQNNFNSILNQMTPTTASSSPLFQQTGEYANPIGY